MRKRQGAWWGMAFSVVMVATAWGQDGSNGSEKGTLMTAEKIRYPETRRAEQVDDYHGTKVADPYRWLEDVDSDETRKWVQAQNEVTLEEYEAAVARGEIPVKRAIKLSARDQLVREFVLQLKLGEVPLAPFRTRFGVNLTEVFAEPLRALAAEGWLTCTANAVQLTRAGLLRVDRLLSRFYDPQFQRTRYT